MNGNNEHNGDVVTLSLRLPKRLHDRLVSLADSEHRSLQRQITYILDRWLQEHVQKGE